MAHKLTKCEQTTLHQITAWANGYSYHNPETNECTPDFSCCKPELFEPDPAVRLLLLHTFHCQLGLVQ